jgi:hypothetical protein
MGDETAATCPCRLLASSAQLGHNQRDGEGKGMPPGTRPGSSTPPVSMG